MILVRNVRINMICVLHGVKWEKRLKRQFSEQKQFVIDQMKNHSSKYIGWAHGLLNTSI